MCWSGLHASVNFKPSFRTSKPTGLCIHLPPHPSCVRVVHFRISILLLTLSIPDTNTRAHAHTTHLLRLTLRRPPHTHTPPRKNLVCIKLQSNCLALEEFNSRLISALPTWVRFPTLPPLLSPEVWGCSALNNKHTRTLWISHTPLPSFFPPPHSPHPLSK